LSPGPRCLTGGWGSKWRWAGTVLEVPTTRCLTKLPYPRTMKEMPNNHEIGPTLHAHHELEKGIYDKSNPLSIYGKCPPSWVKYIDTAIFEIPEIFEILDETEFKKFIREKFRVRYNATENKIRYNFWTEFDDALNEGRQVKTNRVHGSFMDERLFEKYFLARPEICAYMLRRPLDYATTVNEILTFGMEKLRGFLELPETDAKTGQINTKMLEIKLKIIQMMDMRVHGAPTQKSVQITGTLDKDASQAMLGRDSKNIQVRLSEIRAKKQVIQGLPVEEPKGKDAEVIDVVPVISKD
jgi:hypothetical protein